MRCGHCGAESAADKRFCADCGTPLAPLAMTCSNCDAAVTVGQRYCADCGTSLSGPSLSGSRPVVERRVCSVLFCDLVGFTPLVEARDAEEVRELLSRYFDSARTVIERYGGVVEKFIGDAVMAVWGAPVAAEGHTARAVLAALDVVSAVAEIGRQCGVPSLAARAGVVTGEVVVTLGAIGQGMVAGDAVNTAARVQTSADPGVVLVDETTWRLVRTRVAFEPAGEFVLRGKARPVPLWRAEQAVPGVGASPLGDGLEALQAPLVGRDPELRLIKELFLACVERRSPRLLSIVGPAGVGKSRLSREFEKYVDGLAPVVYWHRGRCLSYGGSVAFWALAEMVRQRLGIAADDPVPMAAEKYTAGLDRWVADPAVRDYVRPRLARLLGVDVEEAPLLGRKELFAGWQLFFQSLAADAPVVMLVEDLQHADAGLLDFLEHLLDWARDAPIFVLTLARPELADRRNGWGTGRRNAFSLGLEPLDGAAMTAMLDALVPGMPASARAAIQAQVQGVPLYAVETIRMLVDQKVVRPIDGTYKLVGDLGDLTVPETLQSLLAARLDALPPEARRLVADAAVLGGTFSAEALVAVSRMAEPDLQRGLAELVRREVLAPRAEPLSPERDQYTFLHALFRQVAYDTLSRQERKVRHLAVVEYLASAFPNEGEEVSEVIADHLLYTVTAVPGDPDVPALRERAIAALHQAAGRAERTGAPATALRAYARAAALLEGHDDRDADLRAAQLHEQVGTAAGVAGHHETAAEHYGQATDLYRRHRRVREAARAHAGVGRCRFREGRYEEARDILRAALRDLETPPDGDTLTVLSNLAWVEVLMDSPEADELVRTAFGLAETLELSDSILAELFMARGLTEVVHQCSSQAQASLREAVRLAKSAGDAQLLAKAMVNLDSLLLHKDPHAAVETSRVAIEYARRVGGGLTLAAVLNLVQALLITGEWQDAQEVCRAAVEDGLSDEPLIAVALALVANCKGDRSSLARAAMAIEQAYTASEDPQAAAWLSCVRVLVAVADGHFLEALSRGWAALTTVLDVATDAALWSWPATADAAFALGDLTEVERLLDWLEAHPSGNLPMVLRAVRLRVRARLAAERRDCEAPQAFDRALTALRDLGSPYHLASGLLDHANWLASTGEADRAGRAREEARVIAERLGVAPPSVVPAPELGQQGAAAQPPARSGPPRHCP